MLVISDVVLRLQPVVPLGLVTPRSKPCVKKPQVTPAAFSRSPMLVPRHREEFAGRGGADVADRIGIADVGGGTAAAVGDSARSVDVADNAVGLARDQVDGAGRGRPKFVSYELSLMA